MKRFLLSTLALLTVLSPCALTRADGDAAATDADARAAERLIELRYAHSPAAALTRERIEAILASDAFDEPVASASLLASDAAYAPLTERGSTLIAGATAVEASPIEWTKVSNLITVGASYALTDMASGAVVRIRLTENAGDYAVFAPLTVWDAATLGSIFSDRYDFRTEPCALTVGDQNYLAAAAVSPIEIDADTGMPAACRLYFDGSAPSLGAFTGIGQS